MNTSLDTPVTRSAAPIVRQQAHEMQAYGTIVPMPIALDEDARQESPANLNQILADTITLRDL
jgi:starvation-inducible DNA-binding protein